MNVFQFHTFNQNTSITNFLSAESEYANRNPLSVLSIFGKFIRNIYSVLFEDYGLPN